MRHAAASLLVAFAWIPIVFPSLNAGLRLKRPAAGFFCRPKEMTALTRGLIGEALAAFDEANGKHIGLWAPGFPDLQVDHNSPFLPASVQCSLLFMAQGLNKVLQDQRDDLTPGDVALHKMLGDSVSYLGLLTKCMKHTHGGECTTKLPPPRMPQSVFERKQWSHTLMKSSTAYLNWLQRVSGAAGSMVKVVNKMKYKSIQVHFQEYLKGGGYFL